MNRRQMLGTGLAALLGSFVRPVPRKIDLAAFCRPDNWGRYDLRLPYTVGESLYATDASVCIRVDSNGRDTFDHEGKIPPFTALPWDHDYTRGWKELGNPKAMLAAETVCTVCDGSGYPGLKSAECPHCEGFACEMCKYKGELIPDGFAKCCHCGGEGEGVFPGLVNVGGMYFDESKFRRIPEKLGNVEYAVGEFFNFNWKEPTPILLFRFDGGTGMLMPINETTARDRLTAVRS